MSAEEEKSGTGVKKNKYIVPCEEWLPEKHVFHIKLRPIYQQIQDLPIFDDDVWVVSFPKSGTTWLQEAAWLLTHQLDFNKATEVTVKNRCIYVEFAILLDSEIKPGFTFDLTLKNIDALEKPRNLQSHLLWDMLPKPLRDPKSGARIVYIARNPKDVCVSLFFFYRMMRRKDFNDAALNFDDFADIFLNDLTGFGPYWTHVLQFWNIRNEPNVLFLKYEDMKADLGRELDRLQNFLGVPPLTDEQRSKLTEHLSFEKMKNINLSTSGFFRETYANSNEKSNFFRKGQVGDWENIMSPELIKRFDDWIARNTAGTDYNVDKTEHKS